jgi:hypothetical protein
MSIAVVPFASATVAPPALFSSPWRRLLFIAPVVLSVLVTACGGSGGAVGPSAVPAAAPAATVPANIAGNYTLTVTASSACTQLPPQYRQRTYAATITQTGSSFAVNLVGDFSGVEFFGNVGGGQMTIAAVAMAESLPNGDIVGFASFQPANAVASGNTIRSTIAGELSVIPTDGAPMISCSAADQSFVFSR